MLQFPSCNGLGMEAFQSFGGVTFTLNLFLIYTVVARGDNLSKFQYPSSNRLGVGAFPRFWPKRIILNN